MNSQLEKTMQVATETAFPESKKIRPKFFVASTSCALVVTCRYGDCFKFTVTDVIVFQSPLLCTISDHRNFILFFQGIFREISMMIF